MVNLTLQGHPHMVYVSLSCYCLGGSDHNQYSDIGLSHCYLYVAMWLSSNNPIESGSMAAWTFLTKVIHISCMLICAYVPYTAELLKLKVETYFQ